MEISFSHVKIIQVELSHNTNLPSLGVLYANFSIVLELISVCRCNQGFKHITSSRKVLASLSPATDSNFGPGVYCARKAPHQWRHKEEIYLNNFLPSKKDWQERRHLDFSEWPGRETIYFEKPRLSYEELKILLDTEFGQAVLKKWRPGGKCDYCIPIVCDYNFAQD